jgi:hypothetical protein
MGVLSNVFYEAIICFPIIFFGKKRAVSAHFYTTFFLQEITQRILAIESFHAKSSNAWWQCFISMKLCLFIGCYDLRKIAKYCAQ